MLSQNFCHARTYCVNIRDICLFANFKDNSQNSTIKKRNFAQFFLDSSQRSPSSQKAMFVGLYVCNSKSMVGTEFTPFQA